jgi:hypothetical protein
MVWCWLISAISTWKCHIQALSYDLPFAKPLGAGDKRFIYLLPPTQHTFLLSTHSIFTLPYLFLWEYRCAHRPLTFPKTRSHFLIKVQWYILLKYWMLEYSKLREFVWSYIRHAEYALYACMRTQLASLAESGTTIIIMRSWSPSAQLKPICRTYGRRFIYATYTTVLSTMLQTLAVGVGYLSGWFFVSVSVRGLPWAWSITATSY